MAHTRARIKRERAEARAYSQAIVTEGGRIVWLAGQVAIADAAGRPLAGDFDGQVREVFRLLGDRHVRCGLGVDAGAIDGRERSSDRAEQRQGLAVKPLFKALDKRRAPIGEDQPRGGSCARCRIVVSSHDVKAAFTDHRPREQVAERAQQVQPRLARSGLFELPYQLGKAIGELSRLTTPAFARITP